MNLVEQTFMDAKISIETLSREEGGKERRARRIRGKLETGEEGWLREEEEGAKEE